VQARERHGGGWIGGALRRVEAAGLTDLQRYVVERIGSDGLTAADVAVLLDVTPQAVRRVWARASDRLVAAGLPAPRPWGRGSRRELRLAIPALSPYTEPPALN